MVYSLCWVVEKSFVGVFVSEVDLFLFFESLALHVAYLMLVWAW